MAKLILNRVVTKKKKSGGAKKPNSTRPSLKLKRNASKGCAC